MEDSKLGSTSQPGGNLVLQAEQSLLDCLPHKQEKTEAGEVHGSLGCKDNTMELKIPREVCRKEKPAELEI